MTSRPWPTERDLPLRPEWKSEDHYVQELLTFATSSILFRHLCGGVHILDFLTSEPDTYTHVLDQEWRDWFDKVETWTILQFILHEKQPPYEPPISLKEYVSKVQRLCLNRGFSRRQTPDMPRHVAVGMKPKKIHEVSNFASFVNDLSNRISERSGEPVALVDFGSGQNYLGRTLACPPYKKNVIAIEKKHHNVQGAQGKDIHAKLAKKSKTMRNKKEYKRRLAMSQGLPIHPLTTVDDHSVDVPSHVLEQLVLEQAQAPSHDGGSMTYIEHDISDGSLEGILCQNLEPGSLTERRAMISTRKSDQLSHLDETEEMSSSPTPKLITISLHSCGNLSHHGIRSLVLNRSVIAIAIIGCCYNLLTERLGPASYKIPSLRPNHPRLTSTSTAYDPHGFPMSKALEDFPLPDGGKGVRLNITARMLAVQAPYNWGREDSEMFFRRHFFRALLQRILHDKGVDKDKRAASVDDNNSVSKSSASAKDDVGSPLIVGSLRKSSFTSFKAYVRGALAKLSSDPIHGAFISEVASEITDEVIAEYECRYAPAKKNLSIIWTLMAFSAGVVESIIAVDRWLFLKQQDCVQDAWIQPLFDYEQSPRNLCVVAVKKEHEDGTKK